MSHADGWWGPLHLVQKGQPHAVDAVDAVDMGGGEIYVWFKKVNSCSEPCRWVVGTIIFSAKRSTDAVGHAVDAVDAVNAVNKSAVDTVDAVDAVDIVDAVDAVDAVDTVDAVRCSSFSRHSECSKQISSGHSQCSECSRHSEIVVVDSQSKFQ